jgi:hypothetical protein
MNEAVSIRRVPELRMKRAWRWILPLLLLAAAGAASLSAQATRGRKYTPPPDTAKIVVTVVKETNGKPIENAAVVFHPMKKGKDEGGLELKTNEEGKATIEVIPIGYTVRLQIIADGFQTFGDDYQVTTDTKEIQVKLKRPSRQYSIYEKHPDTQQGGAEDAKPSQPPPQN